jgi:hypothetical protein
MGVELVAYDRVGLATVECDRAPSFQIDSEQIERWPLASLGLVPGVYVSVGPEYEVRIGSILPFLWWRERLANMVGYSQNDILKGSITDAPFLELLGLLELRGVIGGRNAQKLAGDFAMFQRQAEKLGRDFYYTYRQLHRAFEFSSDGGVVRFL